MKPKRGSVITIANTRRAQMYGITRPGTKWLVVGSIDREHSRVMNIPQTSLLFTEYLDHVFDGTQFNYSKDFHNVEFYDILDSVMVEVNSNVSASKLLEKESPY